jgi:hypothetical protein
MSSRAQLAGVPLLLAGTIVVASLAPSCSDPVHDSQVASLGPEYPGIPQGQYHRAGQPCTWCHGPEGPAKTQFSLAGTIFWQGGTGQYTGDVTGVSGATVAIIDSNGVPTEVPTNCVGNFFIASSQVQFAYPILVGVYGPDDNPPGTDQAIMTSQISRASSCAECHFDPPNYDTPGHIFMTAGALSANQQSLVTANSNSCPVDPNLGDEAGGALPQ